MDPFAASAVRAAYDTVANDYAAAFADDLLHLPVDLAVLDAAIDLLAGAAPVLDVGCGPGQVGRYLADRGAYVIGVDLAPRMVAVARERNAIGRFMCADMRALPVSSSTCAGVFAFYSLQHLPRTHVAAVLSEFRRVLTDKGLIVLATHLGEGEVFADELLGHEIGRVGGTLFRRQEVRGALIAHGFDIELIRERGPLPHEHQSKRIYLIARCP